MKYIRVLAVAEACTLLLLLCVAVPLKYGTGLPAATSMAGPLHGVNFVLFIWAVLQHRGAGMLTGSETVRLVLGAFVPLGGLINERWLREKQMRRSEQ